MASSFPEQLDNIPQFLDITQDDAVLVGKVQEEIKNGNLALANTYLLQIQDYDKKIVNAVRLNQLRDAILALEQFYKEDFTIYITEKQNQWQQIIDRFQFKGIYSSITQYQINNIVSFQVNGEYLLYLRIAGNNLSNKPPTDSNYWRQLSIKGERGITDGTITTFDFDWVSNQTYSSNTIVSHNSQWWISLKENINSEPMEGSQNWQLVMRAMQTLYPVQPDQPLTQQSGEIWFEVID